MPTIQTSCFPQTLLCLFIAISSFAQPSPVDSAHSLPGTRAAIFYQSYIGPDAALYSGYAYQPNYQGVQGSAYFLTENLTDGSITCEGLDYTHIPLVYNLLIDEVIISDAKGQLLALPGERIRQFTFSSHHFIRLNNNNVPPGYYELLRSGNATLLVRHIKKLNERIESSELHHYITSSDDYYIAKQDHYYPVSSESGVLAALGDKKKELQQFLQSQNIRFRSDPETAMEAIIDHYNQLPH